MTLQQFQSLTHLRTYGTGHRHPVERNIWDAVVTAWVLGWIGAPAAFLLRLDAVELALSAAVLFLPGLYVALRRRSAATGAACAATGSSRCAEERATPLRAARPGATCCSCQGCRSRSRA